MFSEKASAIARMRQKCVRNSSEMRQKCVKMGLVLLGKEERSKCVKNASKRRGTPLGEKTFWTIPILGLSLCFQDFPDLFGSYPDP